MFVINQCLCLVINDQVAKACCIHNGDLDLPKHGIVNEAFKYQTILVIFSQDDYRHASKLYSRLDLHEALLIEMQATSVIEGIRLIPSHSHMQSVKKQFSQSFRKTVCDKSKTEFV